MKLVPENAATPPGPARQIHIVDIDNLTAGPTQDLNTHRILRQWYTVCTDLHDNDLCFVACSHFSGFSVATVWSDAKVYWRSGENGADYALLDAISETNFEDVNQVWVASGDGIFIPGIEALHAMRTGPEHMDVSVLALNDSMVHDTLALVADRVVTIAAYYDSHMLGLAS